ncbi:O-unit flippase-like protein [Eubacterium callanderi]|uniref:Oligosaccharide flippase family protein n=1 Tax=Eubacterium callanderi TaxID=53442 RepID=A0A853JRR5_9FIRM|nr:oligosaccharide flippase family protein [Eubacterium callanderi]
MAIQIGKKDVIWSYLGYFFNLGTNVLLMPFILRLVQGNELGLWYTFLSVGALVNLLDFGFSPTLIRNITYAWSGVSEIKKEGSSAISNTEPNYVLFFQVLSACKYVSLIIAGLALVIMLTIGSAYIMFISANMSFAVYAPAWVIYSFAVFLNIFYNYWTTSLKGIGDIKQAQISVICSKLVQILVSLIGLFLGGGIIALSLAYMLSGFVLRFLSKQFLFRNKQVSENRKKISGSTKIDEVKRLIQKIWYNAKKTGIVNLCAFVVTQGNTLICSAFIGLEATASYGLCMQLVTVIQGVAQIFFATNEPKMINTKISGNTKKSLRELSLAVVIYLLIFVIGIIGVMFIGIPFLKLIRSNTEVPFLMFLLLSIHWLLEGHHTLFVLYISFSNKIPYVKASIVSAAFILIGQLLIATQTNFGIYALIILQATIELCYNNWKWPSVVLKELEISYLKIIKIGSLELVKNIKKFFIH